MAPLTSCVGDTVTNGLEAYEILEMIRSGEESSLYRVICKTGRLRNRQLALKKVLISTCSSTTAKPHLITTTSLHQALHHPNIVSLLSAFCTTRETFHVLELCSAGDLSEFIRSRFQKTLLESELRGLTKNLADALTYLRKELVIHGDINPSNILLTSDYGVKLSNFKHSVRLSSRDSTASSFCCASSYSAPELASGGAYGFSVDTWSLGCVMVYCVTGLAPLDAKSVPGSRNGPARPVYDLPEHLSNDVKELISRTLHVIPEKRIYLPDILSHPFLANHMPITSLRPSGTLSTSSRKSFGNLSHPSMNGRQSLKSPPFHINEAKRGTVRHASDPSSQITRNRTRFILGDIGNLELRSMLSDEVKSGKISLSTGVTRRIVSDPIPRRLITAPGIEASNIHSDTPARPPSVQINRTAPPPRIHEDLALCFAIPCTSSLESEAKPSEVTPIPRESRNSADENRQNHDDPDNEQIPASSLKLPVGTARPVPLNTTTMSCQTHKTPYGQVTILPSHSLLVDFRESQRRKGLKGDEVFVIEPDGAKISVFSAPHLSSPCCLVEPTQQFSIEVLPSAYWKQYNDAARLLDQIKQRTPKLVVYSVAAKCTLMANAPRADIELLHGSMPSLSKDNPASDPSLRIRFSRQTQSLEFARRISSPRGEEWTKRVIVSTSDPPYISATDWKGLEQVEKNAMHYLSRFVCTCDAVEGELDVKPLAYVKRSLSTSEETKITIPAAVQQPKHVPQTQDSFRSGVSTITSTLSSLNLASRPSKLSAPTTARTRPDLRIYTPVAPQESVAQEQETSSKRVLSNANSAWRDDLDLTVESRGMQTRFIPFVGWCIRYPSTVSQGGRYRIMFLDGVALDIDVDEDWVELKSQTGETTTYNIRDCGSKRKIGERMKVFEEFVSLFDDSEAE